MPTISDNEKGNKYHDEKTGEFTSAGVSAIKDELKSENKLNDKQVMIEQRMKRYPDFYSYVDNIKSSAELNHLIDDYYSIPMLLENNKNLLKKILPNLKVNTNSELDKIGIDLMSFEGDIDDIKIDNIHEKMNFIDVKTSFKDGFNIGIIQMSDGKLVMDGLLNPNYKANNLFILQMFDGLQTSSKTFIAKKLLTSDLKPKMQIPSEAFLVDKNDLYNLIYEHLPRESMLDGFNAISDALTQKKSWEEIYQNVFGQDEMKVYTDFSGFLRADLEIAEGISLHATCNPKENGSFKMFVRLDRKLINKKMQNSKITYANIKNNKIII